MTGELSNHEWPKNQRDHVWGPWLSQRKASITSPATQYRTCVHPQCRAVDERQVAQA
jgi:hypothetical protein